MCPLAITNTRFICGKAEEVLPELLNNQKMSSGCVDHVIGVVDPPRAGLRQYNLISIYMYFTVFANKEMTLHLIIVFVVVVRHTIYIPYLLV